MKRCTIAKKIGIGAAVLSALAGMVGLALADAPQAAYTGSKACVMCHQAMNKDIVAAQAASGHGRAFWKMGEEQEGQKVVADFSKPGAPDRAQAVYAVGAGIERQAFLDAGFKPLANEWFVGDKAWKPLVPGDTRTPCMGCHTTGFTAPSTWADAGVRCEACHGPGSEHRAASAAERAATIVDLGKLQPARAAMVCGQCHSAGKDNATGGPYPTKYRPGDDLSATFTDAKPAAPAPQQEYSEWLQSKHAAANTTCTSCHDPHGVGGRPHQLKADIPALCQGCHKQLTAAHPAVTATTNCTMCHKPHFSCKPGA